VGAANLINAGNHGAGTLLKAVNSFQQSLGFVRPALVHTSEEERGRSIKHARIVRRKTVVQRFNFLKVRQARIHELRGHFCRAVRALARCKNNVQEWYGDHIVTFT
jgi:hypothetical protein